MQKKIKCSIGDKVCWTEQLSSSSYKAIQILFGVVTNTHVNNNTGRRHYSVLTMWKIVQSPSGWQYFDLRDLTERDRLRKPSVYPVHLRLGESAEEIVLAETKVKLIDFIDGDGGHLGGDQNLPQKVGVSWSRKSRKKSSQLLRKNETLPTFTEGQTVYYRGASNTKGTRNLYKGKLVSFDTENTLIEVIYQVGIRRGKPILFTCSNRYDKEPWVRKPRFKTFQQNCFETEAQWLAAIEQDFGVTLESLKENPQSEQPVHADLAQKKFESQLPDIPANASLALILQLVEQCQATYVSGRRLSNEAIALALFDREPDKSAIKPLLLQARKFFTQIQEDIVA